MKITLITFAAAILLVVGCSSPVRKATTAEYDASQTPLECTGREQCDAYWKRAQIWIATNSYTKIQIATDAIIQTYPITDYTPGYSYLVVREPRGNQVELISMQLTCGNKIGCHQSTTSVLGQFSLYVRGAP